MRTILALLLAGVATVASAQTIVTQSNTTPVLINATLTTTGSVQLSNLPTGEIDIIYNVTGSPSGGPSMTFSVAGADPLNAGTTITGDCSATTSAITGSVSGLITCSPIHSSAALVTWTVSSGTFPGVYLTLVTKPYIPSGGSSLSDGGYVGGNLYVDGGLIVAWGPTFLDGGLTSNGSVTLSGGSTSCFILPNSAEICDPPTKQIVWNDTAHNEMMDLTESTNGTPSTTTLTFKGVNIKNAGTFTSQAVAGSNSYTVVQGAKYCLDAACTCYAIEDVSTGDWEMWCGSTKLIDSTQAGFISIPSGSMQFKTTGSCIIGNSDAGMCFNPLQFVDPCGAQAAAFSSSSCGSAAANTFIENGAIYSATGITSDAGMTVLYGCFNLNSGALCSSGVDGNQPHIVLPVGKAFVIEYNGTSAAYFDSAASLEWHVQYSGGDFPSIANWDVSGSAPPSSSFESHGVVSVASSTSGSVTFANAYGAAPVCQLTPTSDPTAVGAYWATASGSALTANVKISGSISFNYSCNGHI